MGAPERIYYPSRTMVEFHGSDKFVRSLIGPIGSGKSVACVVELMIRAMAQAPNEQGIRKTRWAIIRNTYRHLVDTTMQTFFDWIPKSTGVYRAIDSKFTIKKRLDDGTFIEVEFLFRALDRPDDIKKLLSLELTGAWMNECREASKQVMDMLIGRLGRYPNRIFDGGASWFGLIMDTNPPDSDHWYYKLFEEELPDNFALFHQPSGVSEEAENLENLPVGYYDNMQSGKDQEWINVYVHGYYGFVSDGKPVYPEYNDDIHHIEEQPEISPDDTIYVGVDFGLTPAALFGRITSSGQFQIIDELVTFNMGAVNFGRLLKQQIAHDYPHNDIEVYGDPAGDQRAQTDEVTPFMILDKQGVVATPTYTNDPIIRREVVADYMQRLDFSGHPAFVICPKAKMFRKACAGGYKYRRMQVTGEQRFMDKPDKNSRYSHVSDAGQYMFLGAVGGDKIVGTFSTGELDYNQLNRAIT